MTLPARLVRLFLVAASLLALVPSAWAQGDIRYYHTDAIGSVRLVTDASGAVVERYDYTPFGQDLPGNPSPPDPRGFAGKERDQATGLDYFGGRYYQSPAGRFTTVDPVLDVPSALSDPQGWNRYAYARNNPSRYADPDGRNPIKLLTLILKVGHAAYKGYDLATTVSGIVESAQTLASPDATGTEKALAAVSLVGELSGVTDVVKAGRGLKVAAARGIGRHIDDVLRPGGELVGKAGSSDAIRVVQGGAKEAEDTFLRLAEGGVDITPPGHKGMLVELPGGGYVGYRPVSTSGPPAIDINIPGVPVQKIHYVP